MTERVVLVKEVDKPAEVRRIPDTWEAIRNITGLFSGYHVQSFVPFFELKNVMLICNDTGKLDGLPFNCFLGTEMLVGNILFTAYGSNGDSVDLTDLQIDLLLALLTTEPIDDLLRMVGML